MTGRFYKLVAVNLLFLLFIFLFICSRDFSDQYTDSKLSFMKTLSMCTDEIVDNVKEHERSWRSMEQGLDGVHNVRLWEPSFLHKSVYLQRMSKANMVCFKRNLGYVRRITVEKQKRFAMCIIPKVGCTHWINIFRFINNETGGVVYENPSDIPRWTTHYSNKSFEYWLGNKRPNINNMTSFLGDSFRFMFVRDPYHRLWSAWVDKFLLSDFWFTVGRLIAKSSDQNINISTNCPTNITFDQFLQYILHEHSTSDIKLINEHWAPYHGVCDPCVFRPHFIGKLETFSEDRSVVLSAINRSSLANPDSRHKINHFKQSANSDARYKSEHLRKNSHLYHGEISWHEIEMITTYIFDGLSKAGIHPTLLKECGITNLFLARRLWRGFQYNGHIPAEASFKMTQWNKDVWKKQLYQAYSKWGVDHQTRMTRQKNQRQEAFVRAYAALPLDLLKKVKMIYRWDFLQFGYPMEPKELFHRPRTTSETYGKL